MIIDMHTHVYKEKIAAKASQAIGTFYGYDMACGGTTEELLRLGKQAGIARFLISSVATTPGQVSKINDFLYGETQEYPELIGFATLHPLMENVEEELDRVKEMGFKGIKLHPDFQEFYADAPEAMTLYEKIGRRFTILLHAGDKNRPWSAPERIARAAKALPDCTFIAAHLGGHSVWDQAPLLYGFSNVYVDTSSSLAFMEAKEAVSLIRGHGVSRVLFGTDYPMWNPIEELERFMSLPLTDGEREAILHENAEALLRL